MESLSSFWPRPVVRTWTINEKYIAISLCNNIIELHAVDCHSTCQFIYYTSLSSCNLPADKYQRDVGLIGGFGGIFLVSVVVILSVVIGWHLWKRRTRGEYQNLNGELWQLQWCSSVFSQLHACSFPALTAYKRSVSGLWDQIILFFLKVAVVW